jgi:hypothetical protein
MAVTEIGEDRGLDGAGKRRVEVMDHCDFHICKYLNHFEPELFFKKTKKFKINKK